MMFLLFFFFFVFVEGYALQYHVEVGIIKKKNRENHPNAAVHRIEQTYKHKHLIHSYLVHQTGYTSQTGESTPPITNRRVYQPRQRTKIT